MKNKPSIPIEYVVHQQGLLAMIIRSDYHSDGIAFFTPDSFSQQLAGSSWDE